MINSDYQYHIKYNIEGEYNCNRYGCSSEGICRCFKIENVLIDKVDIPSISRVIYKNYYDIRDISFKRENKLNKILFDFDQELDTYCIDRLCRSSEIYLQKSWISKWGPMYYGDELKSINLKPEILYILNSKIEKLFSLNTLKEKIEYILFDEYNYILPEIVNKNYEITEIETDKIIFGQIKHKEKIIKEPFYSDVEYNLIRGICLYENGKWRVIDGYHRLYSTNKNKTKIIGLI